jgi:hypothetical protein
MIDYETFCKIKHYHEQAHLRISQIARTLGLHPRTVAHWVSASQYRRRPIRTAHQQTGSVQTADRALKRFYAFIIATFQDCVTSGLEKCSI